MVFIPLCVISYTLVPNKLKKYHLLLASYVFYWLVSGELIIYLLLSTVSIRCFGLWLDRMQSKMKSTAYRRFAVFEVLRLFHIQYQ